MIVGLFAGIGWSEGLATLDLHEIGLEWIGNAVPPPLAARIVATLTGATP